MLVTEAVKLTTPAGTVSGQWLTPNKPRAVLVFAHGAGADFKHQNMESIAEACASIGLAVLRFNFPFMEAGKRRVDRQEVSIATLIAATEFSLAKKLPVFLGGHSYGGRMASHAALMAGLPAIKGLIFCSFPLHQPKKPARERAVHLTQIAQPMLFVSGSRDDLAESALMQAVITDLKTKAQLRWLQTANHGYRVLKRTRTLEVDVFTEMAAYIDAFVSKHLASNSKT